ncbi:MAG: NlpC/P60 family protein [Eubacterium sp.]|nr:NlpC/P60 family protein [Eubacterium sp.]
MKKRIVCLVLGLVMMFSQTMSVFATTEQQLKQQKSQAQSQLNATNDEIDNLSRKQMQVQAEINSMDADMVDLMIQIDATKEDIANTENSITETQNNITAKETDIAVKESDIQTKTGEIEQTKEELVQAEEDRDQQYEDMKKRIKYIYENGGDSAWVNMIFGTDSFTSMLNRAEYAQSMHDYDRKSLEKYREVVAQVTQLKETLETQKTELENQKAELENQKAELESQKSELENQKASLESQKNDLQYQQNSLQASIDQKKAANSDYASQIEAARQQAREITNLIAQQNAELNRLAEERRAEEARRAAAAAAAEAARQEAARRQQAASQNSSNSSSSGSSTSSSSSSSSNKQETVKPSGVSGAAIVAYADQFVGNPYVWGGNSLTNGIDCSHFVYQVLKNCGVYSGGYVTSAGWRSQGRAVTGGISQAQAGDVICYSGHVAIYDGHGGIVEAKGSKWGITHDRSATHTTILAIRRFI